MINYIVFTRKELNEMNNGGKIAAADNNGHLTVYLSEESYSDMMRDMKEKEFSDD